MKRFLLLLVIAAVWLTSSSCASEPPVFTDSMKPEDYFQRAQERAEKRDYSNAITYYYKCKEKFPDNLEKNIWASYEIAFLYHKMRDDAKAIELLDGVIALYSQDRGSVLPKAI